MESGIHLLTEAGELVRGRRWQDAVEVYLRATEEHPGDRRCWCGLGVCLFKVGNYGMARVALQRARKMGHPRAAKALLWLEEAEQASGAEVKGTEEAVAASASPETPAESYTPYRAFARPEPLPEQEKIDLGRDTPIMLVEPVDRDRDLITQAIEGCIKDAQVISVPYTVSCADTLSRRVNYYVAILDWDADPNAAAGLTQILKIKRPEMLIVCLTRNWTPQRCAKILETGADYHLVKSLDLGTILPLIIAQWARRDKAALKQLESEHWQTEPESWPECMNALGTAMMLVDKQHRVLKANRAAMKMFGKDEGGLVGQRYPTLLYGADDAPQTCPLLAVLHSGKPASAEVFHEESKKELLVQCWPVSSDSDEVSAAIALLCEKTASEGVQAETPSASAQSASVLNGGMDALQCGVVVLDGEGRVTWLNAVAADLLCGERDVLVGKDYIELLSQGMQDHMADPEELVEAVAQAHRSGESIEGRSFQMGSDREAATFRYWSTPMQLGPDSVRRVEHYYPAGQVIRHIRPAVQPGGKPLDQLAEAVGDLLFTTDENGEIIWSSPAASELGYSEEQLRGMAINELAAPEARETVRDMLQRALRDGQQTWKQEIELAIGNGRRHRAELTLLPLTNGDDSGPHGVEGILHDITDRRMNEAIRAILEGDGNL